MPLSPVYWIRGQFALRLVLTVPSVIGLSTNVSSWKACRALIAVPFSYHRAHADSDLQRLHAPFPCPAQGRQGATHP